MARNLPRAGLAVTPVESAAGGEAALRGATVGLRVTAVFRDSPADSGGVLLGDIIVGVDGQPFVCAPESLGATFLRWMTPRRAGSSARFSSCGTA